MCAIAPTFSGYWLGQSRACGKVAQKRRQDHKCAHSRTVEIADPGCEPPRVRSRRGLTILPDDEAKTGRYVIPGGAGPAVPELDLTLAAMGRRYRTVAVRLAVARME